MRSSLFKRIGAGAMALSLALCMNPVTDMTIDNSKLAKAEEIPGAEDVKTITPDVISSEIVLDGDDIKIDNVNGLTFKGFGFLSANSTSDLLLDYKAENPEKYAELMQYLFGGEYPIMTHVKLEMGNDRNNSTGSESATKRYIDEEVNVKRNPGWQIAADAKKINPDVKVSILKWNAPVWTNNVDDGIYQWYKESILAAYKEYGFMVDYINPNTNEAWGAESDVANTKRFKELIAAEDETTIPDAKALELFKKIKLVISDEAGTVSDSVAEFLKSDEDFYNSVDVVGYHYSQEDDHNGGMKWLAEEMDKEVWNSEAQATFSNSAFRPANNVNDTTVDSSVYGTGIGGGGSCLEMGNTFIKGFVVSDRSHVIYQPAVGSFYEGGNYSFKELVSARDPWSGWMHYDAGLLILAHLSKFAKTGWENEDNTAGIWRGVKEASKSTAEGVNPVVGRRKECSENYMTLAAPDKKNFSTVIVNDSEYAYNYTLEVKNMDIEEGQDIYIWETRAADDGAFNENYLKCLGTCEYADGKYSVNVNPFSCVTLTTLDMDESEEHTKALPVEGERTVLDTDSTGAVQDTEDDYLYADNFDYSDKTVKVLDGKGGFTDETESYIESRGGDTGAIARYTNNLNGSFEAYKNEDGNYVLRQQVDKDKTGVGLAWDSGDATVLFGDFRWMNYSASIDFMFENNGIEDYNNGETAGARYAAIGIRQTGGSHALGKSSGYSFRVYNNGEYKFYKGSEDVSSGYLTEEVFDESIGAWNNIKLEGENNKIFAYVNDVLILKYVDEEKPVTSGRIGIACTNYYTQFDNLEVKKISGTVPYYTEFLDNMEIYDLTPEKNEKLKYDGVWSIANGYGKYVYQRSNSISTTKGASLTYKFTGTGIDILGENKAYDSSVAVEKNGAKFKVIVDGNEYEEGVTHASNSMNSSYLLSGLEYGEHEVTIELIDGRLVVDSIGVLGEALGETRDEPEVTFVPAESGVPAESEEPAESTAPAESTVPAENVTPATTTAPAVTASAAPAAAKPTTATAGATVAPASDIVTVNNASYKITDSSKKEVQITGSDANGTVLKIPATIQVQEGSTTATYKVTSIAAKAFAGNKKLKKVVIGKNITVIGANTFKGCKALKNIQIQSSVLKKVGKNAIKGINAKAVIKCPKKKKVAYKKLFKAKVGFKKTMRIK
ncbi:MAG: leucine-rich repeat protein [Lachnospiraceae bacterium]|nr:leucine-rich repeat protein [Lachnospiraceae bacterium]